MKPNLNKYRFLDGPTTRKFKPKKKETLRFFKLMLIEEIEMGLSRKLGQDQVEKIMKRIIYLLSQI